MPHISDETLAQLRAINFGPDLNTALVELAELRALVALSPAKRAVLERLHQDARRSYGMMPTTRGAENLTLLKDLAHKLG